MAKKKYKKVTKVSKNGKHMMPGGMMMSDARMKKMMSGKTKKTKKRKT